MTERIRRRRGSAIGNPVLYATVDEHAKEIVVVTADTLGITQARALELILLSLELDRDGLPTIVDRQAFIRQEELPIPAA